MATEADENSKIGDLKPKVEREQWAVRITQTTRSAIDTFDGTTRTEKLRHIVSLAKRARHLDQWTKDVVEALKALSSPYSNLSSEQRATVKELLARAPAAGVLIS